MFLEAQIIFTIGLSFPRRQAGRAGSPGHLKLKLGRSDSTIGLRVLKLSVCFPFFFSLSRNSWVIALSLCFPEKDVKAILWYNLEYN